MYHYSLRIPDYLKENLDIECKTKEITIRTAIINILDEFFKQQTIKNEISNQLGK